MAFALLGLGVPIFVAVARLVLSDEPTRLDAVEPRRVAFCNVRVLRPRLDQEVV